MSEVRITDPKTGGQKGRKPERFDLFPFDALEEVARVYGAGAEKYADDNWLKGYAWRLSAGALLRHVARFMVGESRDKETGLHHLAHAAWHCLTLITFELRDLGTDDRAKAKDWDDEWSDNAWRYYEELKDEPIPFVPTEPEPLSVAPANPPLEIPDLDIPDEVA